MLVLAVSKVPLVVVAAGIGVVGAILGSAVTGAVTLRAENKRLERERERERRGWRASARLVHEDLDHARATLDIAVKEGAWQIVSLPTDAWEEHRFYVACLVTLEEWQKIANAIAFIKQLQADNPQPGSKIGAGQARPYLDEVLTAQSVLRPYLIEEPMRLRWWPRVWRAVSRKSEG